MKLNAILISSIIALAIASCTKIDSTYKNANAPQISFSGTAMDYLQSKTGVYDSLLKAIDRIPGLADSLRSEEVTLFAANNRSFELALSNVNAARMDSVPQMPPVDLNTIDIDVLDSTLCKYIIKSKVPSGNLVISLSDGVDVETIKTGYVMNMKLLNTNASGFVGGGPLLINFSDRNNSIFTRYWITTQTTTIDIETNNAVINLLTSGHDFGFGSTFIRAVNKR